MAGFQRWEELASGLHRVGLDSNVLVYYLNGMEPYAPLVRHLLRRLSTGDLIAVVSSLVMVELLAKPLHQGDQNAVHAVEALMEETPGVLLYPVDNVIARSAAAISARTRLTLADAVIAATAIEHRCDALISNDLMMMQEIREIPCVRLNDYA